MPISITVDSVTGTITVAPTPASFKGGDIVQWSVLGGGCTGLTISFTHGTPFSTPQLSASSGAVEGGILPGAASVGYGYTVSAVVGGKLYVTPMEPEIIVM